MRHGFRGGVNIGSPQRRGNAIAIEVMGRHKISSFVQERFAYKILLSIQHNQLPNITREFNNRV